MKVNELRIENLVYDGFNAEAIVCDITQTGINLNHGYSTISINELKPIALTEEWLLKFGFVIHEDGYITCPNGRQWILHLDNEFEFEALNIIVIYVHQLQNLFFALTGEELIIKNK